MRHAACGTHPNDDHVRVTSGPDAVSRTRLCREVCRFRTGGAPSAKAVHGLCGGCHPRPAGRTSWMHHGVCRRMWIPSTLEIGVRMRLRAALPAAGRVPALLRSGAVRVHAPRLRVSHGPRGPAALLPRSGPRSARPVVRSCPRPKSARRDVQGVPCAVPGGVVRFRVAQHRRPGLRPGERPSRPVPHGRR